MIALLAGLLLLDVGGPSRGFDVERCGILRTLAPGGGDIFSIAFSANGRRLAVGCGNGTVLVYEVGSWRKLATWEAHPGRGVRTLSWSPDGKTLATGDHSGPIRLWDPEGGKPRSVMKNLGRGAGRVMAFSADHRWIVSGGPRSTLGVWDRVENTSRTYGRHDMPVSALAFSRDGKQLVSAGMRGKIFIWSTIDWTVKQTLRSPGGSVLGVALSPDGRRLVTCGAGNGDLAMWDLKTGTMERTLKGPVQQSQGVAFLDGGRYVVAGSLDTVVWIWDVATGKLAARLPHHLAAINSLAVHPRGQYFATASRDRKVKIWGPVPMGLDTDRMPGFCGIAISPGETGGVVVANVMEGTPAARSGFADGDQLLKVGAVPVNTTNEALDQISSYLSGDTVVFTILRGETRLKLRVTLATRPEFEKQ